MSRFYPLGCTDRDIDQSCGNYPLDCLGCNEPVLACELDQDGICDGCVERKEQEQRDLESEEEENYEHSNTTST